MGKKTGFLAGLGLGAFTAYTLTKYFEPPHKEKMDKFKCNYNMLCKWLALEDSGRTIDELIREAGFHRIAVYGMGNIGKRLCNTLKDSSVEVLYGIDSYSEGDFLNIPVYSMKDDLPEADAIIVTVPNAYVEIKKNLEEKVDFPVCSLEHILFEV